ncbi:MAG: GNAT family N-acetyltransferase [Deltaproteobacteria bacterium]|nr:GNAT family N-acetyltransferase [Deltaproteobacteria bacterium]
MPDKLTFKLITRDKQHSDFDWMNIDSGNLRVGKVRCFINSKKLIVHSINIFPEFEGRGYAKETVEMFQAKFDTIIADRVRHTAIGFWEKMGFSDIGNGNYRWICRPR